MKVVEVLHMNGGNGDISYANNSLVQRKVILMTKPITDEAISDLYNSHFPETLCIADLGCSSGANTFLVVSNFVKIIEKERKKHNLQSPEFYFRFNDLPGNDFNAIFQSLGEFEQNLRNQIGEELGPCFFSGVPGSFYTRLFPSKSLHFVHSSYSLMWLSQVPNLIEKNKGNIYMASTSPPSIIKAYYKQFEKDFSIFLKYRSEELMKGGKMVLTFLGRESEDPSSKECCYIWELLSMALNELVLERKVILMTKPITDEAISDLYNSHFPETLCIADLGCSSGANTFLVVSNFVKIIEKERKKHNLQSPEFYFRFNDLPGNDFNAIFQSLGEFEQNLRNQIGEELGPCFFSGVPGSFYTRLFPSKSLHFVHSSYSLMWLSQVPNLIEKNKGNIYMASTSPPSIIKAYYKQFEKDFSIFLKYRSEELMKGGKMVLTFLGRESEDPSSKECCYIWELLSMALNELVLEGLIEEEKVDSFNIPQYTPSQVEVKCIVEKEGSFTINRLETTRVHWNNASNNNNENIINNGYNVSRCMRAVAEPLLLSQFSPKLMDLVFQKYEEIVSECMAKEKTEFINVTVSLTKKK